MTNFSSARYPNAIFIFVWQQGLYLLILLQLPVFSLKNYCYSCEWYLPMVLFVCLRHGLTIPGACYVDEVSLKLPLIPHGTPSTGPSSTLMSFLLVNSLTIRAACWCMGTGPPWSTHNLPAATYLNYHHYFDGFLRQHLWCSLGYPVTFYVGWNGLKLTEVNLPLSLKCWD